MKRIFLTTLFFYTISLTAFSQNISIEDFRIPQSEFLRVTGNLSGFYWNRNRSNVSPKEYTEQRYEFRTDGRYGYFNEEYALSISTLLKGNHQSTNDEYRIPNLSNRITEKKDRFITSLSAQYSRYIIPDQWYLFILEDIFANYSYTYSYSSDRQSNNYSQKYNFAANDINAGIGYGKMRDASAVFTVVNIIEKLNNDGYFIRTLTRDEIIDIVNIIAKKEQYNVLHERFSKYLLDDVFSVFLEKGLVKNVTAYEVLRVHEVVEQSIFPRLYGFSIQAGYGVYGSLHYPNPNTIGASTYFFVEENTIAKKDDGVIVQAEFGYPFSLYLHAYLKTEVNIERVYPKKRDAANVVMRMFYQFSDKIGSDLQIGIKKDKADWENTVIEHHFSSASLDTYYYIENAVSLFARIEHTDEIEKINPSLPYVESNTKMSFGITYRFY
ncbi:MAG: hypothetical protein WDA22_15960 [Bacteroidota bacterium]